MRFTMLVSSFSRILSVFYNVGALSLEDTATCIDCRNSVKGLSPRGDHEYSSRSPRPDHDLLRAEANANVFGVKERANYADVVQY